MPRDLMVDGAKRRQPGDGIGASRIADPCVQFSSRKQSHPNTGHLIFEEFFFDIAAIWNAKHGPRRL